MYQYLCQLCNTIVTYSERHPCFFYKDDGYVYSLLEPRDNGNDRLEEVTKNRPENFRDNSGNLFQVAQQVNTEESQKLSSSLAERDDRFRYSTHSTISGSLPNVPLLSAHLRENLTENLWNSTEGFEPVYKYQGDTRGASRRKSRRQKTVYEQNEGMDCNYISFGEASRVNCKTSRDNSQNNLKVSINAKSRSSSNSKSLYKETHSNSQNICETSNLFPCVAFRPGIEGTNQVCSGDSHGPADVPISREVTSLVRNTSGLSIESVEEILNPMQNANSFARSSSKNIDFTKKRFSCDVCEKSFDRQSRLTRHYRTHTGEKPFVCDVCQNGFSRKSDLGKHYRIHTGEKKFVCNVCYRRFARQDHLIKHKKSHTF